MPCREGLPYSLCQAQFSVAVVIVQVLIECSTSDVFARVYVRWFFWYKLAHPATKDSPSSLQLLHAYWVSYNVQVVNNNDIQTMESLGPRPGMPFNDVEKGHMPK